MNSIGDYCRTHGLDYSAFIAASLDDVRDELSDQHRDMVEGWMPVELATTVLPPEELDRLVFIENDDTRAVTRDGRGLAVVANFVLKTGIDQVFASSSWFGRVGEVFKEFDIGKFTPLLLRPSNASERLESSDGDWYLEDGNHRALALALRMRQGMSCVGVRAVVVFRF